MKKLLIASTLFALTLTGCAEHPILSAAAIGVAAAGVATAVANQDKHSDKKSQDEYRYDQSRKHHKHERLEMCDFSKKHMKVPCRQGDGEVYRG